MKIIWLGLFFTSFLLFNQAARCQSAESVSASRGNEATAGSKDEMLGTVKRRPGLDFSFIGRLVRDMEEIKEYKTLDGVNVEITQNVYRSTYLHHFQTYILKAGDALEVIETPCAPYGVAAFRVAGSEKVFAYDMACKFVKVGPGGQIRDELSGYLRSLYIDEDGDGKMETQDYRNKMPTVPSWAKSRIKN